MSKESKTYHRTGEPGGAGCPLGALQATVTSADGEVCEIQILDGGEASSEVALLRTIVSRLGVRWGNDEFGWWAALPGSSFPSWVVTRQDDSGNEYLVEANLTLEEADLKVRDLESRAHKQTYWSTDA